MRLNGVAPAGSIAGLAISTGSLIDASLLPTLTLRTYGRDASGNIVLRETASGAGLLQLNVLTGNRYNVSFASTQPFEYVELSVGGLVSVLNTVRVYYAFSAPGLGAPLPVTLTSFTARALANGSVRLTWATASERNSVSFVVERGADPIKLVPVGESVVAAGTSAEPHRYEVLDATAPGGTLYYRLRQLDTDGKIAFSDVVTVQRAATTEPLAVRVWPNPASEYVQVSINGVESPSVETPAPTHVTLYDVMGRAVLTSPLAGVETRVPLGHLSPGRYLVRLNGSAVPQAVIIE